MSIKRLIPVLIFCTASAAMIWAGCKSDCRDEYQSEIESCHLLHDDPDEAEDLQICLRDAKLEHEECVEQCDN